jgi:2-isopropylmalate synthase
VAKRAEVLGHPLVGLHLTEAFAAFKARADESGEIDDAELTAICVATQPREQRHVAA